jgi:hypothetical protein
MKARGNRSQVIIATKVAGAMPGMDRSYIVANRCEVCVGNPNILVTLVQK